MNNLKEFISSKVPTAEFLEDELLTAIIPLAEFYNLANELRNNPSTSFDYLVSLTGCDWVESLGVVYHLYSTEKKHRLVLRTSTTNRENPELYSVTDLWETANLNEREVYGFLGIRFINHPDMRRLFLRPDWIGYPLRKDYDANPELNPLRLTNEELWDTTPTTNENADGSTTDSENTIFGASEYVVNIGPQHPATHGVLHFRVALEGENVKKVDVNCGYIHRGIEKMCETLTYPQTLAMTDRLDYLSAHQNRHALCMTIEKAMGLEVSERVKTIRTIMDELSRIQSHLLFYSTICMDLGGLTAFFYGFRDREMILDILEETGGGRLIQNYNMIGGLRADIHPNFVKRVKDFITYMRPILQEYHDLFTGNIIATQRMKGVGILTKEEAISYAVTGPSGRASGWECDVRKTNPYGVYDKVNFDEVILHKGDVFDRYMVRMIEIEQSMNIIEQLIDSIPEGNFAEKTKPIIRLPEGNFFQEVETARGAFGVYIESKGDKFPYRLKFRSPNLPLVSVVDLLACKHKIADLIAIGGSLDYVVPDIDR